MRGDASSAHFYTPSKHVLINKSEESLVQILCKAVVQSDKLSEFTILERTAVSW